MKRLRYFSFIASTLIILSGCGGGGSGSGSSGGNTPPTAVAGIDRTVVVGNSVTINGSGSDSDGSIVSYKWSEGSTTLATTKSFTYTPSTIGLHKLTLTVTDNSGATATDTIHINVIASGARSQKLVVIRVNFSNKTFTNSASTWANKIFGVGSGELNNYYNEISNGKFQFVSANESDGVNDGIITVNLNTPHPGNDDPANGDFHLWNTFNSAIAQADPYIDFSSFDTNNDGAISKDELQIVFIVAGGESSTGWNPSSSIWGMKSCYSNPITPSAPTHDGVRLMKCSDGGDFARFGELHFQSNPADATIGIIAHELGHSTFDLPDLYDIDGNSGGIGDFGLMSAGSWGKRPSQRPGATPSHMTAWSKMVAGFITPITLGSGNYTARQLKGTSSSNFNAIRVNTSNPGEYFLLENRAPAGYDLGMSYLAGLVVGNFTGGLLITHIDESRAPFSNSDPSHKLVDVIEAANPELDSDTPAHNNGHINNLFFASNVANLFQTDTKKYDGTTTGIEFTNITAPGLSMSVDITIP